jgi:hypothetical protein
VGSGSVKSGSGSEDLYQLMLLAAKISEKEEEKGEKVKEKGRREKT